ncbi:hypothetical protein UCDDS831_g04195 [Diplodia seriata]|uniref:Uncharacterized protein n=1 Tax=Diplodia seriata TaxID=420778 RepID=A0A0G2GYF3_9PEZI|nr:hypothetical protein UCDDS831_g04195 [Diplodia seriata]
MSEIHGAEARDGMNFGKHCADNPSDAMESSNERCASASGDNNLTSDENDATPSGSMKSPNTRCARASGDNSIWSRRYSAVLSDILHWFEEHCASAGGDNNLTSDKDGANPSSDMESFERLCASAGDDDNTSHKDRADSNDITDSSKKRCADFSDTKKADPTSDKSSPDASAANEPDDDDNDPHGKITAEDLVRIKDQFFALLKARTPSAVDTNSKDFKLLYNAQDPGAALAALRAATLAHADHFADLAALPAPADLTLLPSGNAGGPWTPRLANKSDLAPITLALPTTTPAAAPQYDDNVAALASDLFTFAFPDRSVEVADAWHAAERARLRALAAAVLRDEHAFRQRDRLDPRHDFFATRESAVAALRGPMLHAHEVCGRDGFALLHPPPIFVRGERWQQVRVCNGGDQSGAGVDGGTVEAGETAVQDQMAGLVLYYVDDMPRGYLAQMREQGHSAYLVARGKAKERNDIGLEGLDGDEWDVVGRDEEDHDDDGEEQREVNLGAAYADAVDRIAQKVWLQEVCHPAMLPTLNYKDLVVTVKNLTKIGGIPKILLGPGRVKKIIHPVLLDAEAREKIDWSDGRTIREFNRWVSDTLCTMGVEFDDRYSAVEARSLGEVMRMPLPEDVHLILPNGGGLSPVERLLISMIRKNPEGVANMFAGVGDDRQSFQEAVASTRFRAMTWTEIVEQFNELWHGEIVMNGARHHGLWQRSKRTVDDLIAMAETLGIN